MALNTLVATAVSIVNTVTSTLQGNVTHEAWISNSGAYGAPLFATGVVRTAIVNDKTMDRRLPSGEIVLQHASITFLAPITANGATGRREPIDPRDRFTLPSGYVGPVLYVNGLDNPATNSPYFVEVVLG